MTTDSENDNNSVAIVSADGDDSGVNKKSPNRFLIWMWVAAIPLTWAGIVLIWSSTGTLTSDKGIISNLITLISLLPQVIPAIITKIIGIAAIWRRWHGDRWEDQPILLQATGIFTISFAICWLLIVVAASVGIVPVPQRFDFFLSQWIITAFFHMYFGLMVCFSLFAYIALIPPIILCALIIHKKKVSRLTIRILIAVSTLGWMFISFFGMIMSVA